MLGNLGWLEAFYWIVRLGSFHAAAERLGLTQPSISSRIKLLEESLGVALFDRSRRRVRPTAQGAILFEYADRILTLKQDAEGHLGQRGPLGGLLRFGAPDNFAIVCLPRLLRALQHRHPHLTLAVTIDNSRALADRIGQGDLDLAVLSKPESHGALHMQFLGAQDVLWVAHPSLPIAARPLEARDLLTQPIFTTPAPSHLFSILMDWFDARGVAPPRMTSCNSVAVIVGLVQGAAGISVLPRCVVAPDLDAGTLMPLAVAPPMPRQQIFVASAKGATSRAIPELIRLIRDIIGETRFLDAA